MENQNPPNQTGENNQAPVQQPAVQEPQPKKSKTWLIVLIVVGSIVLIFGLLFAGIVGLGVFAFNKAKDKVEDKVEEVDLEQKITNLVLINAGNWAREQINQCVKYKGHINEPKNGNSDESKICEFSSDNDVLNVNFDIGLKWMKLSDEYKYVEFKNKDNENWSFVIEKDDEERLIECNKDDCREL